MLKMKSRRQLYTFTSKEEELLEEEFLGMEFLLLKVKTERFKQEFVNRCLF